jgi:hypothetical protein
LRESRHNILTDIATIPAFKRRIKDISDVSPSDIVRSTNPSLNGLDIIPEAPHTVRHARRGSI